MKGLFEALLELLAVAFLPLVSNLEFGICSKAESPLQRANGASCLTPRNLRPCYRPL